MSFKYCTAKVIKWEFWETKFRRVVIDHNLTWKQHIDYIKGKISYSIPYHIIPISESIHCFTVFYILVRLTCLHKNVVYCNISGVA